MNVAACWNFLENLLSNGLTSKWSPVVASEELKEAVIFLTSPGINKLLEEWIYQKIFQDLNKNIHHEFWKHFQDSESGAPDGENVYAAFGYLYSVYRNRYVVALARLQWLQSLLVFVPSTCRKPLQTTALSAFTPVKGKSLNDCGNGSQFQGPRNLQSPLNEASNLKTESRRLSVTFERGTKGIEFERENSEDLPNENAMAVDIMDGSYIPPNSSNRSYLFDNSNQDLPPAPALNLSTSEESIVLATGEKEEEDELFIRSPIGGTQISASVHHNAHVARPLFSGNSTSCEQKQPPDNAPLFSLRGLSQTSTPGLSLKHTSQTPGPLTPIECHQSSTVLSDSATGMETPFLPKELQGQGRPACPASPASSCSNANGAVVSLPEPLPDASHIFGVSVPSNPMPGVTWSSEDSGWASGHFPTKLVVMIRAVLFSTFPPSFAEAVKAFYLDSFGHHKAKTFDSTPPQGSEPDNQKQFDRMNAQMDEMGLMELISGAAVTQIVHSQIEKYIADQCKGNFDTPYLTELEEWLDHLVLGWLTRIYASKKTQLQKVRLEALRDRLRHFVYEKYATSLINQLFDIIIDYPDSKPAIIDLSSCLAKTDLRAQLVSHLKSALENRLLHPGVNTADILTAYISAIKALRLLESAGVILELVCEPVGRYLRSREDTVRCIVASLTDEGNNELVSELVNTKPVEDDNDDDGSIKHWEDWMPDPMDADPSIVSKSRRSADILSTLVNIYGSKELFVNEYRALLADRILMQYNYDEQRELRYLELLKLRFGEAHLHFCEVMLRDVTESRRVNSRVQETKSGAEKSSDDIEMNAMILSAQFWPAFRDEKITLPPELQVHLDRYTKHFESQKQNRTLVWKPHLGMMNLELELKDETLNFSVSPVQAAIIMKFQDGRNRWTVDELSTELEMTASVLRRKITFWQSQGLLKEVQQDVYQLVEDRKGCSHEMVIVDEEEVESAMASAQQQKEEEMQVFWTYIQSMLSNLNCLTLERIHSMLRIFAMGETNSTEITVQELKTFLDNKVKDQILVFSGGVYRLNK